MRLLPTIVVCLLAALSVLRLPAQGGAGRQFAFLVACGEYAPGELKAVSLTVPEMQRFRAVLLASGYDAKHIVHLHDKTAEPVRFLPTRANIQREFKLLTERLRPEDSIVVVLSGHGIQYRGEATAHFCPVDARVGAEHKATLVPMEGPDGLLSQLEKSQAGKKLLVVNACRNDPVSNAFLAAQKLELVDEYKEEPKGTLALFACSKGQKSYFYDKDHKRAERHQQSLFMHHLIEAWQASAHSAKKMTMEQLLARVRDNVEEDAPTDFRESQVPLLKRNFEGEWLLPNTTAGVPKPGDVHENSVGMKLVYIPAGKFTMGSPAGEKEREPDEGPQHEVTITKGFYLGKYEVTQDEYEKVMGNHFSLHKGAKLPVESVSWEDAKKFCKQLSAKEGKEYRLPTEAEWEYACRAGTTTPFHTGGQLTTEQANYNGNYPYADSAKGTYREKMVAVGSFPPNAFGLHDMHGNVWEWCEDWYKVDEYKRGDCVDPTGPANGSDLVFRGGSWYHRARFCRSAYRSGSVPSSRCDYLGFRVLLAVPSSR